MQAETFGTKPERRRSDTEIRFNWRGWLLVVGAALTLALVSWLTNITTMAQISGEADNFLAFRFTFSKLASSGVAWAGLAILCGWLVRGPLQAAAAGVLGSLLALFVHYGLGWMSGMFSSADLLDNNYWFVTGAIVGGPLGLIGAVARRFDNWGLMARMVVPVGAMLEPIVIGMFSPPAVLPWPERFSSVVCGILITGIGVVAGAVVLARAWIRKREPEEDVRTQEPITVAHIQSHSTHR